MAAEAVRQTEEPGGERVTEGPSKPQRKLEDQREGRRSSRVQRECRRETEERREGPRNKLCGLFYPATSVPRELRREDVDAAPSPRKSASKAARTPLLQRSNELTR